MPKRRKLNPATAQDQPSTRPQIDVGKLLPLELVEMIFDHLSLKDLSAFSLTNRAGYNSVQSYKPNLLGKLFTQFFAYVQNEDHKLTPIAGDTLASLLAGLSKRLPEFIDQIPSERAKVFVAEAFKQAFLRAHQKQRPGNEGKRYSLEETMRFVKALHGVTSSLGRVRHLRDVRATEKDYNTLLNLAQKRSKKYAEVRKTTGGLIGIINNPKKRDEEYQLFKDKILNPANFSYLGILDMPMAFSLVARATTALSDPEKQRSEYVELLNSLEMDVRIRRSNTYITGFLAPLEHIENEREVETYFNTIKNCVFQAEDFYKGKGISDLVLGLKFIENRQVALSFLKELLKEINGLQRFRMLRLLEWLVVFGFSKIKSNISWGSLIITSE
jgi:hypothetical protein